jgi:glycine cleavage system aminomethyltransferase T/glycine/D-amino acid oxidase-like deaminating enzyme
MSVPFPTDAAIIVIGGGVIGTSIAYHLARNGVRDVILLEKTRLTEGATWHAAGLVGQFRSQQNLMRLMHDSVALFDELEADTGQNPGWRKVGSLRVAAGRARWDELLKSHSSAQAVGFDMHMLSPSEAGALHPLIKVDDLVGAAFIPDDGHIDPNSLTQAYARGFRKYGGRIIEGVMVQDLPRRGGRITQVATDHGTIDVARTVVNAAGLWARQVGWMAGVEIPAAVVEHQYLVTEKTDAIPANLPALRDPDGGFYAKPEPGALAIGGWERQTRKVDPKQGFAWDRARHLFDADLERLQAFLEPALARLPILGSLGIRSIVNGPIPISPDGEPVMGMVPGLDNFFAACAFTSGIAASGGAGRAAANWIMHGDPGLDLWTFDIRRFGPLQAGRKFLHDRAVESYAKYYDIHWPGEEMDSARGLRRSPLYQTLKDQGAVFGAKFGWERANWFATDGIAQRDIAGFGRPLQAQTVGREHKAAREAVVLVDMSSFTKFEISGPLACAFLQYLAVANVDRPVGGAAYTQLCNARGGIEADVTIIRRAPRCFWLITGSALGVRDRDWIERSMQVFLARQTGTRAPPGEARVGYPALGAVQLRDITSAFGVINLAGPLARRVLEKITDEDVSHAGFDFMTARDIRLGHAPALAYRVTYIGELGWELYIPTEYMAYVYELLQESGREFGITNMGYRAVDSLRLEKRYLAWGADITPDHNPFEAGLQFLIDWNKGDFQGREALAKIRREGPDRRLVCLALDDPLPVFGGEAILSGGQVVAQASSGNFGYTTGKPLVLGYLPAAVIPRGAFEVNAFGKTSRSRLITGAAYDPGRRKILC